MHATTCFYNMQNQPPHMNTTLNSSSGYNKDEREVFVALVLDEPWRRDKFVLEKKRFPCEQVYTAAADFIRARAYI